MNIGGLMAGALVIIVISGAFFSMANNQPFFGEADLIGLLLSFLIAGILAVIPASLNVVGSGLNPAGSRIIFGIAMGIGILFKTPEFQVAGITIQAGLGLLNKVIDPLPTDPIGNLIRGFYILLGMIFLAGLVLLLSGGGSH